jgi:hypothetical protein
MATETAAAERAAHGFRWENRTLKRLPVPAKTRKEAMTAAAE